MRRMSVSILAFVLFAPRCGGDDGDGTTWGLHLLDADPGRVELIELVAAQAQAHAGG